MVVSRAWQGGGNEELFFNGYSVSALRDEKRSGDGGWYWLHNNVKIMPQKGTLKNGENGKFCYVYFTTIFKKQKRIKLSVP